VQKRKISKQKRKVSWEFLNNFQPERISYHPAEIEVRANFDYVETFTLLD
jgi:hypothetical protein